MRKIAIVLVGLSQACAIQSDAQEAGLSGRSNSVIDWMRAKADQDKFASLDPSKAGVTRGSIPNTIDNVLLPVLVLPAEPSRSAPEFAEQKTSYVVAYSLDGIDISIHGSGTEIIDENLVSKEDNIYSFDADEFTADLNFERYGAVYVVRAQCEKAEDLRCVEKDYLISLAEKIIPIGGKPK